MSLSTAKMDIHFAFQLRLQYQQCICQCIISIGDRKGCVEEH